MTKTERTEIINQIAFNRAEFEIQHEGQQIVAFTYAGVVQQRRNRQTGTIVSVVDGDAADMDTDAGRWQTVCEDHGATAAWGSQAQARTFAPSPADWCEECGEIAERRCP